MTDSDPLLKYREQHKHRLNYMPWLYWRLKDKHLAWAKSWQQDYQDYLQEMEDVEIGDNCFIAYSIFYPKTIFSYHSKIFAITCINRFKF